MSKSPKADVETIYALMGPQPELVHYARPLDEDGRAENLRHLKETSRTFQFHEMRSDSHHVVIAMPMSSTAVLPTEMDTPFALSSKRFVLTPYKHTAFPDAEARVALVRGPRDTPYPPYDPEVISVYYTGDIRIAALIATECLR